MKKFLVALVFFSLLSIPALAQDVPQGEVFGGYSLIYDNGNDDQDSMTFHGFVGAIEGNLNSYAGIVAEVSFYQDTYGWEDYYESGDCRWRLLPFVFGPRFSYRHERYRAFGHYLVGGVRVSHTVLPNDYYDENFVETNFGQALGGGLDIALNDMISVRPVQIDWFMIRHSMGDGMMLDHFFRYSGGLVVKIGSK